MDSFFDAMLYQGSIHLNELGYNKIRKCINSIVYTYNSIDIALTYPRSNFGYLMNATYYTFISNCEMYCKSVGIGFTHTLIE